MPVMAKKRPRATPPEEQGEPRRPNRTGVSLHVYIEPAIDGALQGYLDASEPKVSKTAAVETALREFLRARGHWPPSTEGRQ
jgi:hypothetical protein